MTNADRRFKNPDTGYILNGFEYLIDRFEFAAPFDRNHPRLPYIKKALELVRQAKKIIETKSE